jgi:uncharacterized protein (DUF1778 family)
MSSRATRSETLDLRLTRKAKKTLQAAAAASSRSVSEFVLESELARPSETLADRGTFGLDAVRRKAFMETLDSSPRSLPRLKRLSKNLDSLMSVRIGDPPRAGSFHPEQ